MNILFPVDGSECSTKTLEWATRFLDKTTSRIYLLCAIDLATEIPIIDVDINQATELLQEARKIFESNGFTVEKSSYVINEPVRAICQYADETGISQIIIGSHGKNALTKLVLGSVSEGVFNRAKQPVLIFRNHHGTAMELSHLEKMCLHES